MMLAVGNLRAKCEYEDKHKVSGKERVKEKWSSTLCGNPSVLLCDAYNCFSDMTHNFGSDLGKMTFVSRLLMTSFHDLITDSTLKLFSTYSESEGSHHSAHHVLDGVPVVLGSRSATTWVDQEDSVDTRRVLKILILKINEDMVVILHIMKS